VHDGRVPPRLRRVLQGQQPRRGVYEAPRLGRGDGPEAGGQAVQRPSQARRRFPSQAMTTSPRAVIFDFGGVIWNMEWEAARALEAEHGLPQGSLRATLYDGDAWSRLQRGRGGRGRRASSDPVPRRPGRRLARAARGGRRGRLGVVKSTARIKQVLVLLVGVIAIGSIGYQLIEKWTLFDSLFMTVTAISSVGFEEVHPLSRAGRWFTIALIVTGRGSLVYGIGALTAFWVEGDLVNLWEKRRME